MLVSSLSVSYWAQVAVVFAKFWVLRATFLHILQNAAPIPPFHPGKDSLKRFLKNCQNQDAAMILNTKRNH